MSIKNKFIFFSVLLLSFLAITNNAFASVTNGTIDSTYRYAWGENIGWVDFGSVAGNVHISDTILSGSVYGENVGWINLSTITNTSEGVLGGYAWGENVGWVDFSKASIGTDGVFTGGAYGENIGWIIFGTGNNKVATDWRPQRARLSPGGGQLPPATPPVVPPIVPPVVPPVIPPVIPPTTPPAPPTTPTAPVATTSPTTGGTLFPLPENNISNSVTESFSSSVRTFFTNPITRTLGNIALALPVAVSIFALMISLFSGAPFLNQIFYSLVLLSQILGFARKPKPWGTIYDSYTKRPLPFARVEILNEQSRKLQSTITDANGRYGFLISERLSNIKLQAYLTKYDFPSKEEPSVVEQKLYPNIYRGGFIDVSSGLTNFDLPMDPRDKTASGSFYFGISSVKLNNLLVSAANVLFVLGATFGTANAIVNPSTLNFTILALIFITFLLRISGFKLKPFGLTKDQETNQTLPFGFIALHNQGGERVNFTVSDDRGRYFLLTSKGNYLLKAYTPSHISPTRTKEIPISADKGWISKEIGI